MQELKDMLLTCTKENRSSASQICLGGCYREFVLRCFFALRESMHAKLLENWTSASGASEGEEYVYINGYHCHSTIRTGTSCS